MQRVYLGGEELILSPDPTMPPGREGAVYPDPSDPGFVIKLPHSPDDEWREKLRVMLANPLNSPNIAWPTEAALSSDRSTVVGCRLPYAGKKYAIQDVFTTDPSIRWMNADYAFRLDVAINLAAAIDKVHNHGCVVGDLSPKNILVGKDGTLCLIDTDSFQVSGNGRVFRCNVGAPDHTPPELHGQKFTDVDRTVYHDAFGLAVFVFELLVGPGTHPFAARYLGTGPRASLLERIRLGIWPYGSKGHPEYVPRTGSPFDLLHQLLHPLMFSCFEAGHTKPDERPLPDKWLAALNDVKQDTDFVRVLAPHREAAAQSRQRKATLAALAPQSRRRRTPLAFFKVLRNRPRPWSRKAVLIVLASLLVPMISIGLYCALPKGPRIDFAKKGKEPLPTPVLYQQLSAGHRMDPPRSSSPNVPLPLPTPSLYEDLARRHR